MINKLALATALALLAGCASSATSGDSADDSTTTAAAASNTTVVAPTTPASTAPATTAPAPTTTVALEPLVLREDGLGPFDFGPSTPTDVIAALTARFGPPARNDAVHYADESHRADGYFETVDAREFPDFNFEYGQTVCWTGDFCAEFGGYGADLVALVGWRYSGPPHMLASDSNLTIGAEWADFPSMIVGATCYTTGGGTHHGITMTLAVDGGWDWLVSDGAGGFVESLPDPHATKVTSLSAGVYPFAAGDDC
ncbi:MAG: hypothetical protein K8R99_06450 [Actinomycetia bacterium]|nr:hypothetical protein [Actinomycetes bacterium]